MTPEDNGGHHYITEMAILYLAFDFTASRWVLDSATTDGNALDEVTLNGPFSSQCECADQQACNAARKHAEQVSMPNAAELLALLQDAINDQQRAGETQRPT